MRALCSVRSDDLKIGGTSWKKLKLWTESGTKNMWIRNWSLITFGEYNSTLMSRAASLNKKKGAASLTEKRAASRLSISCPNYTWGG